MIIENGVPIVDVAHELNVSVEDVEHDSRALGLQLGRDWRGTPVLAARDAARLVDGSARRERESTRANAKLNDAVFNWHRECKRVVDRAVNDYVDERGIRGRVTIKHKARIDEVKRKARRKFIKNTPPEVLNRLHPDVIREAA